MVVPSSTANASQYVLGGVGIVVGCWTGSVVWTNCVLLTPEGIIQRQYFRRTTIPWGTVESFSVALVPRRRAWRTVRVELRPMGYSYLTTVAGSEQYIERIIAEFEEYRATLAGAQGVRPESPSQP